MSEKPLGMLVGARVKAARTKLGIGQRDFAELLGTSQSHISDIETGRFPDLRISTVARVAEALGVLFGHLIDPSPAGGLLLELAERNAANERENVEMSEWHWRHFNADRARYYQGVADGLKRAQHNQLDVTRERRAADARPDQDSGRAV